MYTDKVQQKGLLVILLLNNTVKYCTIYGGVVPQNSLEVH